MRRASHLKVGATDMKKTFKYTLLFLLALFLSRHWIFEKTVSFHPISEQPNYIVSDSLLYYFLAAPKAEKEIENIIRQALDMTAERLEFASQNTATDPNISFYGKRAHCVGYAAFFATAFNFLINKNSGEKIWEAKHVRGKISFLGIDMHQFSDSPFFRDHDFNVVENIRTGEQYIMDASVRDVLWIKYVVNISTLRRLDD